LHNEGQQEMDGAWLEVPEEPYIRATQQKALEEPEVGAVEQEALEELNVEDEACDQP
jgi:hypothetical protein